MIFKLASLVLVLLTCQTVLGSADDEYFKKAVFLALKAQNGQFSSHVKVVRFSHYDRFLNVTNEIEEKHSPKLITGNVKERKFRYYMGDKKPDHSEMIYINGTEYYRVWPDREQCFDWYFDKFTIKMEAKSWIPEAAFNEKYPYKILGPSVLLEVFYEKLAKDKQNVKCEQAKGSTKKNAKKCSISFNETIRLDYSFFDGEDYTMYPDQIEGHVKNQTTGVWNLQIWLDYSNFTAIFGGEPIVSTDLPIGYGCKRLRKARANYPKPQTNFGEKFELEYDVTFRYVDRQYGRDNYTKGIYNYTKRIYSGKMFVDRTNSMNIAETIDEITNASLRTFYNTKSHLLHQVTLDDNKCITFNYTSRRALNFFYLQDTWVKREEFYNATDNIATAGYGNYKYYSYLQDSDLDGVRCSVFENQYLFYDRRSSREWYGRRRNSTEMPPEPGKRANKNQVRGDHSVIVTHWYPKKSHSWPGNSNGLSVPKRIKMIITDFMAREDSFLQIDVKAFSSSPKEFPKFDTSKCTNAE